MQIVLKEDIEKLGHRGEVVKVADGYARNYLLPFGKALLATPGNLKVIEREKRRYVASLLKEKEENEALARRIQAVSLTLVRKVGENDVCMVRSPRPTSESRCRKRGSSWTSGASSWPSRSRAWGSIPCRCGCTPRWLRS